MTGQKLTAIDMFVTAAIVGGVSRIYFEIARFDGDEVIYRESWEAVASAGDFDNPQHCFEGVLWEWALTEAKARIKEGRLWLSTQRNL